MREIEPMLITLFYSCSSLTAPDTHTTSGERNGTPMQSEMLPSLIISSLFGQHRSHVEMGKDRVGGNNGVITDTVWAFLNQGKPILS